MLITSLKDQILVCLIGGVCLSACVDPDNGQSKVQTTDEISSLDLGHTSMITAQIDSSLSSLDLSTQETDTLISMTDLSIPLDQTSTLNDMNIPDASRDAVIDLSIFPPRGSEVEFWLSQTGLYDDIQSKTLAEAVHFYQPLYPLWSDGSDKQRWIRLPPAQEIDTADMDHWQFPVGSIFYKEFSHNGKRLETRVIVRMGDGPRDYWMGAFIWSEDERDALFYEDGLKNVRDTSHDVPPVKACGTCHNGEPGKILGFSALQLSGARAHLTGLELHQLSQMSLLTQPPVQEVYHVPGSGDTQRALGYLSANCGNCHNERGTAWPDTDLDLTLSVTHTHPEETPIYQTSIGIDLQYFNAQDGVLRVTRGRPDLSAIYLRMELRGLETQMPPLGTEMVHTVGLDLIQRWIISLEE